MINCLLLDDEPFALEILADDLSHFPELTIAGKISDPAMARELLSTGEIDLLFSDIQMPRLLGTELIRSLEKPPLVIFTTAYSQYAVEGFELNAIDYLVKPIRRERLAQAIEKARNQLELIGKQAALQEENYFFIFAEYKKIKLFFEEIIYIEGLKDYVKIYLENRVHPLLTRSNLKGMESRLPSSLFLRIHNSYIINTTKLKGFGSGTVLLPSAEIPVGSRFSDQLQKLKN
jgi:DNA-binding LytR/AlgR family response regulator